jgi:hypothetical protein
MRRYPFFSAEITGETPPTVFVDAAWSGFSDDSREALVEAGDEPAPRFRGRIQLVDATH